MTQLSRPATTNARTTISHCARDTTGESTRVTGPNAGVRCALAYARRHPELPSAYANASVDDGEAGHDDEADAPGYGYGYGYGYAGKPEEDG